MVQTTRNEIKDYKIHIEKNAGITVNVDSLLLGLHSQHGHTRDSTNDKTQRPKHTRRFDTYPFYSLERAVACRRPGALVNRLQSAKQMKS